ncbi:hydrolase [Pilimelia anulata]|uniref:Hydrolase n=1 Tax=Pilimelia anulata TaxID=53371 RepID=A0A8J3BC17_9ACTN|nr:trypsin-like serine protease [Pilimelia anulata]GGK09981.1 hydrolase [Pilimelia anulata]
MSTPLPWISALHTNGRFTCTSSIIAAEWVITAKHCVDQPSLSVRVGSLTRSSGGSTANVAQVVRAPGNNDVALLKLASGVQATYLTVAAQGSLSVGMQERVYGWGYQNSDWTNLAENLRTSSGTVTELDCASDFGDVACIRNDGDTAGGDSGGPMLNSAGDLVAVCSIGNKPTDGSGFGGYNTIVSSAVRSWIQQTAGV